MSSSQTTFTFKVEGLVTELRVVAFRGVEEMSALFHVELSLQAEDRDVPFASVLGRPAVLTIRSTDVETPRHIHGIVSDFEQGAEGKKFVAYRATLVPEMWKLD